MSKQSKVGNGATRHYGDGFMVAFVPPSVEDPITRVYVTPRYNELPIDAAVRKLGRLPEGNIRVTVLR